MNPVVIAGIFNHHFFFIYFLQTDTWDGLDNILSDIKTNAHRDIKARLECAAATSTFAIMKEQIAAFQPCFHVCGLCLKVLFLNPALPSHPPHSLASLGIE